MIFTPCLQLVSDHDSFMSELGYDRASVRPQALSQMDVPTKFACDGDRFARRQAGGGQRHSALEASPPLQPCACRLPSLSSRMAADCRRRDEIVYDLLLLAMFRRVRPPDEQAQRGRPAVRWQQVRRLGPEH
jgi:hypothetical protein